MTYRAYSRQRVGVTLAELAARIGPVTRPFHVLLVSPGSGTRGGGELYLEKLGRALVAQGHTVSVWIPAFAAMDELADLMAPYARVVRSRYRSTYQRKTRNLGATLDLPMIRRCAREFCGLAPDVLHLNKQNTEDALDLLLACERTRIPTLTTIHVTRGQHELGAIGGKLRDAVSRLVLRRSSTQFLTVAREGERSLRRFVDIRSAVHLVYNGAPTVAPGEREENRQRARHDWGLAPEDVVFGCAGRIEAQKNPLFLLALIARLRSAGLPARAVWIGTGSMEGALRERAAALGVADSLRCDGWRTDGRLRMCGFDVFTLPSLFEGFPFVLPEAMHCGLPALATDVDGNGEGVVDGVTGYLCTLDDLDAWSARAVELARSPARRQQLGAEALAIARRRFSLESMARDTTRAYASLLGRTEPRIDSRQLLDVDG
jgi:glycosyltransferase involved in cell wall biosynthesis